MQKRERGVHIHEEWKGMTQPVGLVIEPIVLDRLGIFPEEEVRVVSDFQRRLEGLFETHFIDNKNLKVVTSFKDFCEEVLDWQGGDLVKPNDFYPDKELEEICVFLEDYQETLKPDWIIPEITPENKKKNIQILVKDLEIGTPFDQVISSSENKKLWQATHQQRFERLLKETENPIGILWNGVALRLVYSPRGESSGHITFPLEPMITVDGRPMIGALEMLLGPDRLFEAGSSNLRLINLMEQSRKEQNEVSSRLSEQVLEALWILVRGFDEAEQRANAVGESILQKLPEEDPSKVYGGFITVLLRLVFLLYTEDEELMPKDSLYSQNYSVSGLAARLRMDRVEFQNAMEGRRGAWGSLLSLFRLIYDGGGKYENYLPARHGDFFNPDKYPFLEGRDSNSSYIDGPLKSLPSISDDVVEKILDKLLVLDGQILSYRSLDVEQIGSVYEGIMGFTVERTSSLCLGLLYRPPRQKVAITCVFNADELLALPGGKRVSWLKSKTEVDLNFSTKILKGIRAATNLEEVCEALENRLSPHTPRGLKKGSLVLQPTSERRKSGSHYTPRSLTEPIIKETFRPWLEQKKFCPTAEEILDLKICDPAMGSGAFLVATCRFLGTYLVNAWERYGYPSEFDKSFDKDIYARRLIVQRCIYGVDKNIFAVNLAKLSLWLITLSKDLPFTFIDHALKSGDSLVGYSSKIIESAKKEIQLQFLDFKNNFLEDISTKREKIFYLDSRSDISYDKKKEFLTLQDEETKSLRRSGDLIVASFFDGKHSKDRKAKKNYYLTLLENSHAGSQNSFESQKIISKLYEGEKGIKPFHWEMEFPEVFNRSKSGFDFFLGNPPFAGDVTFTGANKSGYFDYLKDSFQETGGRCDLCAFFFRRCFDLLNDHGSMGLIATNSIYQGDTRYSGLRWICLNKGTIFFANKRYKWPGLASVVISVISIHKGKYNGKKKLDNRYYEDISAYLLPNKSNEEPKTLISNKHIGFKGSMLVGMGFTFSDSEDSDEDTVGKPSTISKMQELLEDDRNKNIIYPYIGGEEVNDNPLHSHRRFVIDFRDREEDECKNNWPEIMQILEKKVKPERTRKKNNGEFKLRKPLPQRWWQHGDKRPKLYESIKKSENVMVTCRVATNFSIALIPSKCVFSDSLTIFSLKESYFAILQSTLHEDWARLFGSSLGDGMRYTHTSCLETFPFPKQLNGLYQMDEISTEYLSFRGKIMLDHKEGLTQIYNRFNNPNETSHEIFKFRTLHEKMNKEVLRAYGWEDISFEFGFMLDYLEIDNSSEIPQETREKIDKGELFFVDINEAKEFDRELKMHVKSKKKLTWRFRWSNNVRDRILGRLIKLNEDYFIDEIEQNKLPGDKLLKSLQENGQSKIQIKDSNDVDQLSFDF